MRNMTSFQQAPNAIKRLRVRCKRLMQQFSDTTPSDAQFREIPANQTDTFLALAKQSADPRAWLGLQGDKLALCDAHGGFLLFVKRTMHWIALGGVMGKRAHSDQLLAEFLRRAQLALVEPVFYQADPDLALALQRIGGKAFAAYKLGAEAHVALANLSFAGADFSALRNQLRRCEREGLHFSVIGNVSETLMPTLERISTDWLAKKKAREKRFSLGGFNAEALRHQAIAVVWQQDQPIAFASLCPAADMSVLGIDLMRASTSAPRGSMDFLFAHLMQWAQCQGFAELSLGMSPLKDVERDALARSRLWPVLAKSIVRHGTRFYNFQGLARFKDKWQPEWHSRYMLMPHRSDALPALLACALAINKAPALIRPAPNNMLPT